MVVIWRESNGDDVAWDAGCACVIRRSANTIIASLVEGHVTTCRFSSDELAQVILATIADGLAHEEELVLDVADFIERLVA